MSKLFEEMKQISINYANRLKGKTVSNPDPKANDEQKFCEECEEPSEDIQEGLCEECYEHNFCECGQRLEDSYGTPGDGFCIKCR